MPSAHKMFIKKLEILQQMMQDFQHVLDHFVETLHYLAKTTIIHKIFQTSSSFHVK